MGALETGHLDMVHDAQLDYYGKRLATCSSDRTVKVFDLSGEQRTLIADLRGHEGPIWQVSWAHPRYGSLLASASFDHRVIIWKEGSDGQWVQVKRSDSEQQPPPQQLLCTHLYATLAGTVALLASFLHLLLLLYRCTRRHPRCTLPASTASRLGLRSWGWCWPVPHQTGQCLSWSTNRMVPGAAARYVCAADKRQASHAVTVKQLQPCIRRGGAVHDCSCDVCIVKQWVGVWGRPPSVALSMSAQLDLLSASTAT